MRGTGHRAVHRRFGRLSHPAVWKAQIAYLARHFRAVTFDPRGNGKPHRRRDPALYAEREFAADAVAVMEASRTERAVVASISSGVQRALLGAGAVPAGTRRGFSHSRTGRPGEWTEARHAAAGR